MILRKFANYEVKELEKEEYEDYVLWQSRESGADKCANLVFDDLKKYKNEKNYNIKSNPTIIDVGCRGNAEVVRGFHNQGYTNCYGIDIGYDAETNWLSLPQNIQSNLKRQDAQEGLHFDNIYDLITCSHVLEHCSSPQKLMDIFHQSLDNEGRVHIQIPLSTYQEYLDHHPHFAYWEDKEAFFNFSSDCGFDVDFWEYGTEHGRTPFDDLMVILKKK
jgi:2-polyprenyl-3-methyl-5-hydroxy-6-metoxy-1,4-benzoquinol methylase